MIIILLFLILILLFFIFINTNRIKDEIIENQIINSQQIENNNLINTWTPLTCDPYYQSCSGNYFYNDGYYYPL